MQDKLIHMITSQDIANQVEVAEACLAEIAAQRTDGNKVASDLAEAKQRAVIDTACMRLKIADALLEKNNVLNDMKAAGMLASIERAKKFLAGGVMTQELHAMLVGLLPTFQHACIPAVEVQKPASRARKTVANTSACERAKGGVDADASTPHGDGARTGAVAKTNRRAAKEKSPQKRKVSVVIVCILT
jgi:hypothetical protein